MSTRETKIKRDCQKKLAMSTRGHPKNGTGNWYYISVYKFCNVIARECLATEVRVRRAHKSAVLQFILAKNQQKGRISVPKNHVVFGVFVQYV
jgi:hypothetical protein